MKRKERLWIVANSHAFGLDTVLFHDRKDAEALVDDIESHMMQPDNERVSLTPVEIVRDSDILMTIDNFIDYFTSDEAERERMKECAQDYLQEDEYLNEEDGS